MRPKFLSSSGQQLPEMPPPGGRPTVSPPPWRTSWEGPLLTPLSAGEAAQLSTQGFVLLPARLTPAATTTGVIAALQKIEDLGNEHVGGRPDYANRGLTQDMNGRTIAFGDYAAEHSEPLAAVINHPQMTRLAEESLLGAGAAADAVAAGLPPRSIGVVFDHCNALVRHTGCQPHGWHTHGYSDDDPHWGSSESSSTRAASSPRMAR